MQVLKVGGSELDNDGFLAALADEIAALAEPPVIVHGGGKETTRLMQGGQFVDGLRVTDDATLKAAVMGLVGTASTRLVQALTRRGVPALGLSGHDAGLVTVVPHPDRRLGRVGRPCSVHADRLKALLSAGFVPCLAPICCDAQGELYNVNADDVAKAVASELHADALLFLTAVEGVYDKNGVIPELHIDEIEGSIAAGIVTDGMIPKLRAAADAAAGGLDVRITDLRGWRTGAGTTVINEKCRSADTRSPYPMRPGARSGTGDT